MIEGAQIRNYEPRDLSDLQRIHKQGGLDYKFPDIGAPIFFVKKVMTVNDKVVGAVLFRMECETYLMLDRESALTPHQKMDVLKDLQLESFHELWTLGIDNAIAYVPAEVEKFFAKRLHQLGWEPNREGWRVWSRETRPRI